MYVCIFIGIMSAFVKSNKTTNEAEKYVSSKASFAVCDNDNSELSRALVEYLSEEHELYEEEIKDETESIQDNLYNRNIHAFLRIPAGFEENVKNGNYVDSLEVITIPGTSTSKVFESDVDSYLGNLSIFLSEGYSVEDAVKCTNEIMKVEIAVTLPDVGNDSNVRSVSYSLFNYLGWIFVVMMIVGITPVLQVFGRKELRDRIECSSYKFSNVNKELILGVAITGFGICIAIFGVTAALLKNEVLTEKGLWFGINMVTYMMVAVSLAFLVSKLTNNEQIVSMIANIVSLGMSFICGIFVPMEFLGENVKKVAHLLPAFWYNKACVGIDQGAGAHLTEILSSMGIQILFAIVILIAGVIIARKKRSA